MFLVYPVKKWKEETVYLPC